MFFNLHSCFFGITVSKKLKDPIKQRKLNEIKLHEEIDKKGIGNKNTRKIFDSSGLEVVLLRNQIDEAA